MLGKRNRGILVGLVAILALLASACSSDDDEGGSGGDGGGGDSKALTIGYIPWDEDIAVSNLFKYALDQKGYEVDLQQADVGPIYQGLADGDLDLFLDSWLPATHKKYWDRFGEDVEDLGTWYDGATLNIAVPSYMEDVNSMEDLNDIADDLDGKITGIEPSAGEMDIVKNDLIPTYDLDLTVQPSSTPAMLSALGAAIDDEKPIAVTLWHPHRAYSAWDLKDLEDPEGAMGSGEELHMLGKDGFSDENPEVTEVVKDFTMTDEEIGTLEDLIHAAGQGKELEAVEKWATENKDFMDKMFGGLDSAK